MREAITQKRDDRTRRDSRVAARIQRVSRSSGRSLTPDSPPSAGEALNRSPRVEGLRQLSQLLNRRTGAAASDFPPGGSFQRRIQDDEEPLSMRRAPAVQRETEAEESEEVRMKEAAEAEKSRCEAAFGAPEPAVEMAVEWGDGLQMKSVVQVRPSKDDADSGPAHAPAPGPLQLEDGGIPSGLRRGVETLSGVSMEGVKVHYDSPKPARLNALAYAQGKEIHLAPRQEQHLPHEAWHIAQQSKGIVKPTFEAHGVAINDDPGLEAEADAMGRRAAQFVARGSAVEDRRAGSRGGAVQRAVENATYDSSDKTGAATAKNFFDAFNNAAQKAYQFALSVPSLGAYANLNGYTKLWVEKWNEYLTGGRPKLLAATFGYVIESLVSAPDSEFYPSPPSGYSIIPQVTSGGTRPDLVLRLKKGFTDLAWLDLTASGSVDHIYDKDDWSRKIGNFAEVTYPSLEPGTLAFMVQNKDNQGQLSTEEFEKRRALALQVYRKRKAQWLELGKSFSYSALRSKIPASREMQGLKPQIPRAFIQDALAKHFGSDPGEKMVPSILAALGVNPVSWGYALGFSQSEKAGEAWLVDNDPSLS